MSVEVDVSEMCPLFSNMSQMNDSGGKDTAGRVSRLDDRSHDRV